MEAPSKKPKLAPKPLALHTIIDHCKALMPFFATREALLLTCFAEKESGVFFACPCGAVLKAFQKAVLEKHAQSRGHMQCKPFDDYCQSWILFTLARCCDLHFINSIVVLNELQGSRQRRCANELLWELLCLCVVLNRYPQPLLRQLVEVLHFWPVLTTTPPR